MRRIAFVTSAIRIAERVQPIKELSTYASISFYCQ
jgi:hypothetical protein